MNHLKNMARNHLKRSSYDIKANEYGNDKKKGGILRTSKQTWIRDRTYTLPSSYMGQTAKSG